MKFVFRPGLRPGPRWGSSRRSPSPPNRLGRGKPPPHSPPPRRLGRLGLVAPPNWGGCLHPSGGMEGPGRACIWVTAKRYKSVNICRSLKEWYEFTNFGGLYFYGPPAGFMLISFDRYFYVSACGWHIAFGIMWRNQRLKYITRTEMRTLTTWHDNSFKAILLLANRILPRRTRLMLISLVLAVW